MRIESRVPSHFAAESRHARNAWPMLLKAPVRPYWLIHNVGEDEVGGKSGATRTLRALTWDRDSRGPWRERVDGSAAREGGRVTQMLTPLVYLEHASCRHVRGQVSKDGQVDLGILGVIVGVIGVGATCAAWMFPDFRHWLLPKLGFAASAKSPKGVGEQSATLSAKRRDPNFHPGARTMSRIQCPLCRGSGNEWGRYSATCHKCNGRGEILTYRGTQPACRPCRGTGLQNARYRAECPVCGGVGLMPFDFQDEDEHIAQPGTYS